MPPTPAQIDVLAKWLHKATGVYWAFESESKYEQGLVRNMARALLTDPPAVLVEAVQTRPRLSEEDLKRYGENMVEKAMKYLGDQKSG